MKFNAMTSAAACWALGVAAYAQITIPSKYSVTSVQAYDLGTLGGNYSEALDINDLGDIVGWAIDGNGKRRAFIRLAGQNQNLALDDGSMQFVTAQANGISNTRVVVGQYNTLNADGVHTQWHGFYYYPGIWMTEIESNGFNLGFPWEVEPRAINNLEYIVGRGSVIDEPGGSDPPNTTGTCYTNVPLFWNGAGQYPFGLNCYPNPLDGTLWNGYGPGAYDINDSNWVAGADGGQSAFGMFVRKGVQVTQNTPVPKPLWSPWGLFGFARGINNAGHVVGAYGYDEQGLMTENVVAFYWDGVAQYSTALGLMPGGTYSLAYEINDQNMVVGSGDRNLALGGEGYSAYIYHADFGMIRLKAPGETNLTLNARDCWARAVNNRKSNGLVEVVGQCWTGPANNQVGHATLWQITVAKKPNVLL